MFPENTLSATGGLSAAKLTNVGKFPILENDKVMFRTKGLKICYERRGEVFDDVNVCLEFLSDHRQRSAKENGCLDETDERANNVDNFQKVFCGGDIHADGKICVFPVYCLKEEFGGRIFVVKSPLGIRLEMRQSHTA